LAVWREDIVQWLYADLPTGVTGQPLMLPAHYTQLCAAYKLWLLSPAQLGIPVLCARPDAEEAGFPVWYLRESLTHLNQLALSVSSGEYIGQSSSSFVPHPGQTVALATLIEYAVATYGRERLPALVAGLGRYHSWQTLLPAVYGVSTAEFEQGWQAYLVAHYSVPALSSGVNHNN
jgi:hypothetical protein